MENYLLEGENLISQTPNSVVTLTSHRIRYNDTSYDSRLVSIMLEKVSSCEVTYQSSPALLLSGVIISLLGGVVLMERALQAAGVLGMALGVILVLIYLSTRRHIVRITSDGGTHIGFETKGLKREAVVSFINSVEKAKYKRVVSLSQQAFFNIN